MISERINEWLGIENNRAHEAATVFLRENVKHLQDPQNG